MPPDARLGFWETPRNLYLVLGAFLAAVAVTAGFVGYSIGQDLSLPHPVRIIVQPGAIVIAPAPSATLAPAAGSRK